MATTINKITAKRITYISAKLNPGLKQEVIEVLKRNKDCFAWDYDEIPGLKRELVEHRLPIKDGKKPIKQTPRRFAPAVLTKIKAEIERLLRCKFIRTTRYVEWLANIVPVIKKNGSLRIWVSIFSPAAMWLLVSVILPIPCWQVRRLIFSALPVQDGLCLNKNVS